MSIRSNGEWVVTLPGYVALLVGLLTVVGPRGRRRTVKWSWNLLWVAVGVLLITAGVSLPGPRRLVPDRPGDRSRRAVPVGRAVRAGVRGEPRRGRPAGRASSPCGCCGWPTRPPRSRADGRARLDGDQAARALTRSTDHRLYELTTRDGDELDLVVVDGDRQVVGMLTRLWRSLRMRGIEGRSVVSLRQAAERAALLAYAARAAGRPHAPAAEHRRGRRLDAAGPGAARTARCR